MIIPKKTVTGDVTEWKIDGHAKTEVCNGFSALLYTFVTELKNQSSALEYEIERRDLTVTGNNSDENVVFSGADDRTYIRYEGQPYCEQFFETGIRLLSEVSPGQVEPLQTIKA